MKSKKEIEIMLLSRGKQALTRKDLKGFSREYRLLGRMLLFNLPENLKKKPKVVVYQELFGTDLAHNPWLGEEGEKLGRLFFGNLRWPYIPKFWDSINFFPYQRNEVNKPFRSVPITSHLDTKLDLFCLLTNTYAYGFSSSSLEEQAQLCGYKNNVSVGYFLGTALQEGHVELQEIITNIINGEDEITKVSKQHIRALLHSGKEKNWQLVESLLLESQEGQPLRQDILDDLVRSPIEALKYFIDVLLENDLTNSESVLKTIDSWFGFGWKAPQKEKVDPLLRLASSCMKDEKQRNEALKSDDLEAVFTSLWSMAIEDVSVANEQAFVIASDAAIAKDKRLAALLFSYETERKKTDYEPLMETNWGQDLELDYWMLKNTPVKEIKASLMKRIIETADNLPAKGVLFEGSPFKWNSYVIDSKSIYSHLIADAGNEQLTAIARSFGSLPVQERKSLMKRFFPLYYRDSVAVGEGYQFFNKHERVEPLILEEGDGRRKLIHEAIKDKDNAVKATGLQAFFRLNTIKEDLQFLESMLGTPDAELRDLLTKLLFKESEETIINTVENLLNSAAIGNRLTGLEILGIMKKIERAPDFVMPRINSYFEEREVVEVDEILLVDAVLDSTDDESVPYTDLSDENLKKVTNLFSRKGAVVYQLAMLSLTKQSETNIEKALSILLSAANVDLRVAGLSLAHWLLEQNKCEAAIAKEIAKFRKRKTMSMSEKIELTKFS